MTRKSFGEFAQAWPERWVFNFKVSYRMGKQKVWDKQLNAHLIKQVECEKWVWNLHPVHTTVQPCTPKILE